MGAEKYLSQTRSRNLRAAAIREIWFCVRLQWRSWNLEKQLSGQLSGSMNSTSTIRLPFGMQIALSSHTQQKRIGHQFSSKGVVGVENAFLSSATNFACRPPICVMQKSCESKSCLFPITLRQQHHLCTLLFILPIRKPGAARNVCRHTRSIAIALFNAASALATPPTGQVSRGNNYQRWCVRWAPPGQHRSNQIRVGKFELGWAIFFFILCDLPFLTRQSRHARDILIDKGHFSRAPTARDAKDHLICN